MVSEILDNEVCWVGGWSGHAPVGIPSQCHWIYFIIMNTKLYRLGVGI